MPIYAYRCEECGFAKDVLQKMSDDPLSDCPECGKPSLKKQVTAAGFQLKGSGWYVTDFRDSKGGSAAGKSSSAESESGTTSDNKADAKGETKAEPKSESASASTSTSAATPATPVSTPKGSDTKAA
jgi:putative FmdB family regulatory protein